VDHVQGEELTPTKFQRVKYTDFSSGWGSIGATSQAGNGYLGQPSLIVNAPVLNARTTTSVPTETGVSYTASFYVRYVNGSGLVWMYRQFSGEGITATPITVTSEWTRVQVQFTGGSGSAVNFGVSPKVAGESVEIAMPQVEEGTTASDFVENTTGSPKYFAAATYAPRVPMILVEPAATNLVENSEDFSQDVTLSNCTVQSGFTAPDASSNAYKLIEDNTNSLKLFRANNNTNTTASTSYSSSIFVKAGERTKVRIYGYHLTNQFFAVDYDLISNSSLGTVTSNTQVDGHSIKDCGNGWKRITVTGQKSSTYSWDVGVSPLDDSGNVTYQGDGTSGVYIWGAQLEQGTVATSFIPTAGSTVTRAADDLVIDGSDFTDFYNQSEGTVYIEWQREATNTVYPFTISDGGSGNYIRINNASTCRIETGSSEQASLSLGSSNTGQINRAAVSFAANNFDGSKNGGAVVSDSAGTTPTVNQLQIGGLYSQGSEINGHIKRLIYWPHHSDNL
tara:strand:+ start:210 stop:1730 length:1521 start_codon:yes stop_codon:yes gene_type:complete